MKTDAESAKRSYRMVARADAARATENRVLEEAVAAFTESPYEVVSLEAVAERAGVTKRTVLRRFGTKEALFVTAMAHAADVMMRRRNEAPIGDVAGAVSSVIGQYEEWGPNRLRLLSQEDRIAVVAEHVAGGRAYHRAWVERTFGPLLAGVTGPARRRRLASLVMLTDVYTWRLLRRDLGLSRADTERTLVELITKLDGEH